MGECYAQYDIYYVMCTVDVSADADWCAVGTDPECLRAVGVQR